MAAEDWLSISLPFFFSQHPIYDRHCCCRIVRSCTSTIRGVRVEAVEDPLMREIRYLNKLIDELAKGKAMGKILRG